MIRVPEILIPTADCAKVEGLIRENAIGRRSKGFNIVAGQHQSLPSLFYPWETRAFTQLVQEATPGLVFDLRKNVNDLNSDLQHRQVDVVYDHVM